MFDSHSSSQVNVSVPQAMVGPEGKGLTRTPVITVPDWLPISAVRLVHPVTDYTTNITRDVIIKQLIPIRKYVDRPTGRTTFQRLVAGLNIIVPWPKIDPVEHKDHPVDTLRLDVEEKTFVPTLLHPPMPSQILDELRGKYSRFRTRHSDEFIAKVEANEAERARLKSKTVDPTMRTPLQNLNRQLRQERKALGQPELSEEMLEKIGRVIARNIRLYEEGEVAEQQSYSAKQRRDQEVMRETLRKERQETRRLEGHDQ
jgi:large subunit ribosomal protein L24